MKYVHCIMALLGILLAISNQHSPLKVQTSPDTERTITLSQDDLSPISAMEKSETSVSVSFRHIAQKKGTDGADYVSLIRFRQLPDHIVRITNCFQKSTSLFLIYQSSISLFKVVRQ